MMKGLLCVMGLLCPLVGWTQWRDSLAGKSVWETEQEWALEAGMEQQQEDGQETVDASAWRQALDALRLSPLCINQTDDERLTEVLHLSAYQIYQLQRHVSLYGCLYSPSELVAVEGFSVALVQALLPYISFTSPAEKSKWNWSQCLDGKSEILFRCGGVLEPQAAYDEVGDSLRQLRSGRYYEGSAVSALFKYTYRCSDVLRLGITAEKDAGESFFRASNPQGFDYYSAYAAYQGKGRLRKLVIGDYQVQFGQGISVGMGFQPLAAAPEGVQKSVYGLKAHTSANECQFLRGAASVWRLGKHTDATVYAASQKTDAVRNGDSLSSIPHTGYHRTLNELSGEKRARRHAGGLYLAHRAQHFRIGGGVSALQYSLPFEPEMKAYSQFRFHGRQLCNASADWLWNYRRLVFYGELACSGKLGLDAGCLLYADDRLQLSLDLRLLPKDFHALSDQLDGTSDALNEHSLEWRGRVLLGRNGSLDVAWKENFYPWLKYQVDAPSRKSSLQCRYQAQSHAWGGWLLSYRWYRSYRNQADGQLRLLQPTEKHSCRLRWTWEPADAWTLQCQWDAKLLNAMGEWEKGSLFSQQLAWNGRRIQWAASIGFFDTDTYQTALYIVEKDMLYATTSALCNGKGIRAYVLMAFRCTSASVVYVRLASFQYQDRQVVGSGSTQIDAPHRTELKIQWVWKG